MNRRTFVSCLLALPGLRWLRPKPDPIGIAFWLRNEDGSRIEPRKPVNLYRVAWENYQGQYTEIDWHELEKLMASSRKFIEFQRPIDG